MNTNKRHAAGNHRMHYADPLRSWLLTVIVLLFCFAGAGCSQREANPLRVASNMWPGYEPFYIARHLGYLDEKKVRLIEYTSTSEVIHAFRNETIDGGLVTLDEALQIAQDVPDIRLVLVADISNGADVIMAKPEIKSLKDLKGHRVGAETTALGAYVLLRALQLAGLKREDVVIVPLEFSEQETAFKRGDVDAVVTFEPTRAKLLNAGARQIFDSSRIPGEIVDVLVVRNAYLQAHPENVQLFVKSFYRGQDYFKTNQQDALQIAAKRENTTAKDVLSSLSLLRIPNANESRNMLMGQPPALLKNAQTLAAIMVEQKLLQKTVDVPALFDKQALEPILP